MVRGIAMNTNNCRQSADGEGFGRNDEAAGGATVMPAENGRLEAGG